MYTKNNVTSYITLSLSFVSLYVHKVWKTCEQPLGRVRKPLPFYFKYVLPIFDK